MEKVDLSVLDGMKTESAVPGAGGNKIKTDGNFKVRVTKVGIQASQNPKTRGAVYFIVEYEVLESSVDSVQVGAAKSWSNDLTNEFFGLNNCKNFMASASGLDLESEEAQAIGREDVAAAIEKELLVGVEVGLTVSMTDTQSGFPFAKHAWKPIAA